MTAVKSVLVLGLLTILSACVGAEITSPVQPVKLKVPTSRVAGYDEVTVRTHKIEGGKQVEVVGANCTMVSEDLSVAFVSPAKIEMPMFVQSKDLANRGAPNAIRIECKSEKLVGIQSLNAKEKQLTTVTNAGIAGAMISTLISAAVATSQPWQFEKFLSIGLK